MNSIETTLSIEYSGVCAPQAFKKYADGAGRDGGRR